MTASAQRTSRIEARIAPDSLEIVKHAARLEGRSVSDFVVAAAYEVAIDRIDRRQAVETRMRMRRQIWNDEAALEASYRAMAADEEHEAEAEEWCEALIGDVMNDD